MNKSFRIVSMFLLTLFAITASAQDKKDIFNPVNHAVTSQMIAPDARAAGCHWEAGRNSRHPGNRRGRRHRILPR